MPRFVEPDDYGSSPCPPFRSKMSKVLYTIKEVETRMGEFFQAVKATETPKKKYKVIEDCGHYHINEKHAESCLDKLKNARL